MTAGGSGGGAGGGPHEVLQPAGWAPPRGYTHGIATAASEGAGRMVFVAGQVGWDPVTLAFAGDDLPGQVAQALANVAAVLREAGAEPAHVVRLTWYLTDRAAYLEAQREIGAAYRAVMGRHFPPMSVVVVAALLEQRAKVEIEATAVVPAGGERRGAA
jgi:enamine deaminase RidA (YjgF/YER057c/UK114 family)